MRGRIEISREAYLCAPMGDNLPLSVLIVDDEPIIRRSLSLCLELEGHVVRAVGNLADALDQAGRQRFDLAFVDIRLGTQSGLDLIPDLLRVQPELKIVVITAYATVDTAVEAMRRGAWDYLPKPFEPSQVAAAAHKVGLLRASKPQERADLVLESRSPAMRDTLRVLKQVSGKDSTVLLRGESGTGKSALARVLHGWSRRAQAPFATISCPTLTAELLASELFGHARGSFTGAISDKAGRVESCEGGTLFLDEIGELPLTIQPQLLRLLQEREYERVGESRTRKADVRIVAATHVDLAKAVEEGRFREDLYWRLNVVEVVVPPLRERREDIPALAQAILLRSSHEGDCPSLSEEAMEVLARRPWPGNLRELANVVERAVALSDGPRLGADSFGTSPAPAAGIEGRAGEMLPLERLEEIHIRRVLAASRTLEDAAAVLGIDVATLWRKRKKYVI